MAKQKLKVGLFICTYNRPDELIDCIESLNACDLSDIFLLVVDDGSTVDMPKIKTSAIISKGQRLGIKDSIKKGYEFLFDKKCDFVINLDGDAIVKPNFIQELIRLHKLHPDKIITGFHSMTQGRHPVIEYKADHCIKRSVGGINMAMGKEAYNQFVLPALSHPDNWDRQTCINAGSIVCAVPSLVQHIGYKSSMNHNEEIDLAADFYRLELPNVTLVGATGNDLPGLIKAADISCRDIKFGDVRLLSHLPSEDPRVIPIEPLLNKEAYNEFIVRRLYEYINTPYMLIIQPDGYVLNWKAWSDEFLQYDYIGASWVYKDGMNVGNGGFSLRTRALMEHASKVVINSYPEDHQICRNYRSEFAAFKFAPVEIADQFSIEAYGVQAPFNKYCNSFGFHGYAIDYTGWKLPHIPTAKQATYKPSMQPKTHVNIRNGVRHEIHQPQIPIRRRW